MEILFLRRELKEGVDGHELNSSLFKNRLPTDLLEKLFNASLTSTIAVVINLGSRHHIIDSPRVCADALCGQTPITRLKQTVEDALRQLVELPKQSVFTLKCAVGKTVDFFNGN